jgi:4'-phosphopantetheinyl transferase
MPARLGEQPCARVACSPRSLHAARRAVTLTSCMRQSLLSHSPISAVSAEMPLPADVEVRMVDVRGSAARLDAAASLLTTDELERARRIVVPGARRRFVMSRATLRILLALRLEIEPQEVRLAYDAYGKPHLEHNQELTFNVSHSGNIALIALGRGGRVGVDVEQIDPCRDWRRLARATCAEGERFHLLCESRTRGASAFFERWAAKEAFLKARGVGLSSSLTDLVLVRDSHGGGGLRLKDPPCGHSLHQLQVPIGYKAALALLDLPFRRASWLPPFIP